MDCRKLTYWNKAEVKVLTTGKTKQNGCSHYELTNHLGNVLSVVTDRRTGVCGADTSAGGDTLVAFYQADIVSAQDYYPFGMQQPGRKFSSGDYRYGFNGKEMDNEVYGNGNIYNYGFRIYNPRLSKFLSVAPLTKDYPHYTPYQFAGNKPIWAIDLDGLEEFFTIDGNLIGVGNPKDKRKMLVLNKETAKSIKNMNAQQCIDFLATKPADVVIAPNAEFINKIQALYEKTTNIEYGFAYGIDADGNLVFSKITHGTEESWDPNPAFKELWSMEGVTVLGTVHSHPSGYEVTRKGANDNPISISTKGGASPSTADTDNQKSRLDRGLVQQSGLVISIDYKIVPDMMQDGFFGGQLPNKVKSTENVNYYGGSGEGTKVSFKELQDASQKIYEKE